MSGSATKIKEKEIENLKKIAKVVQEERKTGFRLTLNADWLEKAS